MLSRCIHAATRSQHAVHSRSIAAKLPGRLGTPDITMRTEPRLDPRVIEHFKALGMLDKSQAMPISANSTREELLAFFSAMEQGFGAFLEAACSKRSPVPNVERRTEVVKGTDGNDIKLFIHYPQTWDGSALPCIYHVHGGGMTMCMAAMPYYSRWRDQLASRGALVVGVEFRNAAGEMGPYPFPAGLNDCMSGLQWTHDHRHDLNISKIVLSGESGGGNLALAMMMKAKQDGKLYQINGAYIMCPFIYGDWANAAKDNPELLSHKENDEYLIRIADCPLQAQLYTSLKDLRNPLAWPFHAKPEDLHGLPPVTISVNELDPLRDEGLWMYRKLVFAGNDACSRIVAGTPHGADMEECTGAVFKATLRDIVSFAQEV